MMVLVWATIMATNGVCGYLSPTRDEKFGRDDERRDYPSAVASAPDLVEGKLSVVVPCLSPTRGKRDGEGGGGEERGESVLLWKNGEGSHAVDGEGLGTHKLPSPVAHSLWATGERSLWPENGEICASVADTGRRRKVWPGRREQDCRPSAVQTPGRRPESAPLRLQQCGGCSDVDFRKKPLGKLEGGGEERGESVLLWEDSVEDETKLVIL